MNHRWIDRKLKIWYKKCVAYTDEFLSMFAQYMAACAQDFGQTEFLCAFFVNSVTFYRSPYICKNISFFFLNHFKEV